ncbi:hypothetical protein GO730_29340 [Spirosoma sp. HMF3257]|uniref:Uncharacterized protein n=1 Tax=Spirosoma telluris TaxID=2183553 RepID=A0A327NPS9_9BACT|nr:hypothetical protein [Spirosoma telluris]RAI77252.1 hypothetical protein HMF3257_29255 [Spirosoma telluris]
MMATYDYYDIVGELISNKVIPKGDEFDFEMSPTSLNYSRYFQFCQENLSERCNDYNIQPAKFYFRESFEVNARAGFKNKYYVIAVNKGTIHTLYDFFYNQNNIFEESELADFNQLNAILDVPVGYFMYQSATLFTYYHELGHLIQFSNIIHNEVIPELWLNEQYDNSVDNFDFTKHIYEFDADVHAANSVCFHPIDLWSNLDDEYKTLGNLEKILSLTLASVFSYFMFLMKNKNEEIYYNKYTHPHPLIRITYILTAFIDVAKIYYPTISQQNVINDVFKVTTILFKKSKVENIIIEYQDKLFKEYQNITDYISLILEKIKDDPTLVVNTVHKKQ